MTLRSQRKSITPSPVKLSPSVNKKALATKIVLSDIKARRLKIPKKVVHKDLLVSKEPQLKQEVSIKKSNVQQYECTSEDSAEISNGQRNVQQPKTTQYIDDWEDCIEQSRSMSEQALNVVKLTNIPTPTNLLKFDTTPTRDMDSMGHKQSKYNFKKSTCFQKHNENVENQNDLRQMIDEKKKTIEKDQKIIRTFSLRNKNPFSNKSEELPKSYSITGSVPFNRVKKGIY